MEDVEIPDHGAYLLKGRIDPKTNLKDKLSTCPQYLEKRIGATTADITKHDDVDFYNILIAFNPYQKPDNIGVSVIAKDNEKAKQIADKIQSKLGIESVEVPRYTSK